MLDTHVFLCISTLIYDLNEYSTSTIHSNFNYKSKYCHCPFFAIVPHSGPLLPGKQLLQGPRLKKTRITKKSKIKKRKIVTKKSKAPKIYQNNLRENTKKATISSKLNASHTDSCLSIKTRVFSTL